MLLVLFAGIVICSINWSTDSGGVVGVGDKVGEGVTVKVGVGTGVSVGGCGIMMVRLSSGPKIVPSSARRRQIEEYVPGVFGAA